MLPRCKAVRTLLFWLSLLAAAQKGAALEQQEPSPQQPSPQQPQQGNDDAVVAGGVMTERNFEETRTRSLWLRSPSSRFLNQQEQQQQQQQQQDQRQVSSRKLSHMSMKMSSSSNKKKKKKKSSAMMNKKKSSSSKGKKSKAVRTP